MRRSLVLLVPLAIATTACSASGPSPQSGNANNPPPDHHVPTAAPWWPEPEPTEEPWFGAPSEAPAAETPYADVTYDDPGVNPYIDADEDRESTFALDVDTASYAIAQRYVHDGNLPDPASVRVEEWVNAFDQHYGAPEDGAFAIHVDGAPSPFLPGDEVLLRIGVQSRPVHPQVRQDAALTFVIDTSGSMGDEDRLGLVQASLERLVDRLAPGDSVAIVTYGNDARVVLEPTSVHDAGRILGAIRELWADGSTNAEAGLRVGYRLAADFFRPGAINRVILASDGVANVGVTDPDEILRRVDWDRSLGIELVTVGFGMGNYNDTLMEQLADHGDGFYAYVNRVQDADQLFGEDLVSTLQAVALDAKAQVVFDPETVESYRLLGYENRAVPDDRFRDDSVEAGAIGAGHASTALYALRLSRDGGWNDRIGTVTLRWTDPESSRTDELRQDVRLEDLSRSFTSTSSSFRLSAVVAAAAEVARGSRWVDGMRLRDVSAIAGQYARDLPDDPQVAEFLGFLDAAARLDR
jgi:Ca-activated chloride channel family protein